MHASDILFPVPCRSCHHDQSKLDSPATGIIEGGTSSGLAVTILTLPLDLPLRRHGTAPSLPLPLSPSPVTATATSQSYDHPPPLPLPFNFHNRWAEMRTCSWKLGNLDTHADLRFRLRYGGCACSSPHPAHPPDARGNAMQCKLTAVWNWNWTHTLRLGGPRMDLHGNYLNCSLTAFKWMQDGSKSEMVTPQSKSELKSELKVGVGRTLKAKVGDECPYQLSVCICIRIASGIGITIGISITISIGIGIDICYH